jgi:hypothetical protein
MANDKSKMENGKWKFPHSPLPTEEAAILAPQPTLSNHFPKSTSAWSKRRKRARREASARKA